MDNVANVVKPLKCNGIYEAMRPSMGIIVNIVQYKKRK
jgi:hypothetical protein